MWYLIDIKNIEREIFDEISCFIEIYEPSALDIHNEKDEYLFDMCDGENNKIWQLNNITAYFTDKTSQGICKNAIAKKYPNLPITTRSVAYEDWQNSWKQYFPPIKLSNKLYIHPSWETPDINYPINIELDPGMAFGSGTHATTYMCLDWLSKNNLKNKTIVDYGCGSGILAISAMKLGAKKVFAVDIDDTALEVCDKNAKKNNANITITKPEKFTNKADIIIANILLPTLINLRDELVENLNKGGTILLSGILKDQINELKEHYLQSDITLQATCENEEWSLIVLTKIN